MSSIIRILSMAAALMLLAPTLATASENDRRILNALASSDVDWMQAFAVHSLPAFDAEELLVKLGKKKQLSPHAAYLVSLACVRQQFENLCAENALHLKALDADPSNLAGFLLAMDVAEPEQQAWLLKQAADKATRSDLYWYRGGPQMLEVIRDVYRKPEVLEPEFVSIDEAVLPAINLTALQLAMPIPSFSALVDLCQFEPMLHESRRQHCNKIAKVMQKSQGTLIEYMIGNVIERRALLVSDPDDPQALRLFREKIALRLAHMCAHAGMLAPNDSDIWNAMPEYMQAVHQFGEIKGNQLHGEVMYAKNPELFNKNPAECADYPDLPDAELKSLISKHEDPRILERFEQEQAEARAALEVSEETIK